MISFSDVNTIKLFIKLRHRFSYTNNFEDISAIYMDLDFLIKRTRLSDNQFLILRLFMAGFDEAFISKSLKIGLSSLSYSFNSIASRIKEVNDFYFREFIEISGAIRVNSSYKQCSKCKQFFRANSDFFAPNKRAKSGLRASCRRCR